MTTELDAVLAEAWTDTALDEHASIASFARHVLELMALGAPATLVTQATQAMADEIDHARRAFKLASRFAGEPLGPGPLDATDKVRDTPSHILAAVAAEACLNETASVAACAEALKHSTDPEVVECLTVVVADETRHAQLGWATLRWGLVEFPEARPAVAAVFAQLDALPPMEPVQPDPALAVFGVLDAKAERAAGIAALHQVVRPAAIALWQAIGE